MAARKKTEAARTRPRGAKGRAGAGKEPSRGGRGEVPFPGDGLTLGQMRARVAAFVAERDWEQFHNPKNVAMSIAIEAAELMELFQWLDLEEARKLAGDPGQREKIEDELADIVNYCCSIANVLAIDLGAAFERKLEKNRRKYPAAEYYGRY